MFPVRRLRDPRAAASREPERALEETRQLLSRATSLLNPPTAAEIIGTPSTSGLQTQRQRERINIFRPQAKRQRRSSAPNPKKRKYWEHTFCCLASRVQESCPSPIDRAHLLQAGLGDKRISIIESADAEDLHFHLLEAFSKLRPGGGYELMRTSDGSNRFLDVIPCPPSGYTITYLKNVAGQAKVYIRPLQKDLDLSPIDKVDEVSMKLLLILLTVLNYNYRDKERDKISSSYLLSQLLSPGALPPRSVPKLWINGTTQPAS